MDSDEVLRRWEERSGAYSPEYYAYYGPDATSRLLLDAVDPFVGNDAAVLELGCSSGRHLAYLHENGFRNLVGVDVNGESFEVMAEAYPDLAETGTFYAEAIEDRLGHFEDRAFDVAYSVETLQHVHPDNAWAFEELARVTDDVLVTVENEEGRSESGEETPDDGSAVSPEDADVNYIDGEFPLYYRDWNAVFTAFGFREVASKSAGRDTLRTFRRDPR